MTKALSLSAGASPHTPPLSTLVPVCTMLSRFITRPSSRLRLRLLTLISSPPQFPNPTPHSPPPPFPPFANRNSHASRSLSTNRNNDGGGNDFPTPKIDLWNLSAGNGEEESVFGEDSGEPLEGISSDDGKPAEVAAVVEEEDSWLRSPAGDAEEDDIFKGVEKEVVVGKSEDWATGEGEAWSLGGGEDEVDDVFDIGGDDVVDVRGGEVGEGVEFGKSEEERELEVEKFEEERRLKEEEKMLSDVLKGPNRAFGDLVAASGITEEMLDSLMALKDMDGVIGLPPLAEIEDMRLKRNTQKSTRAEIERQKQEEVASARVRQVDEKGRAYGTGRRKCSIARVWIQPGDGRFVVNEKEFDVYFPMLDHRAALLRPFSETKTLGLWNIDCTVKGGGVSGQVGAIQLGISRALQNWEPDLRPPLRSAGFLTRDPRVVERKKPGKAKARKSFQWVKR